MQGDNILSLKKLPDNSIDSIVSDPPYGLSFMGKKWDYDVPSVEFWKEVYRVLKPGGHVLSFGGTRTYHRMTVNIEDAGFEIRDQIQWIYGSGFPKSHNIGKSVDKIKGNEREVIMKNPYADGSIRKATGNVGKDDNVEFLASYELENGLRKDTKGTSEWEGWGTALKPANEPICVARKPISEKTVADNVLKWGTGGINIDGCRVGKEVVSTHSNGKGNTGDNGIYGTYNNIQGGDEREGRFPANIILDQEAGMALDEQSGVSKSSKSNKVYQNDASGRVVANSAGGQRSPESTYGDTGGASRFFKTIDNEPICVARKPLSEKTVADNVLKWGTGGINIDGCRVKFDDTDTNPATNPLYRHQNADKYKQVTDGGQRVGENVSFTNSMNPPSEEGRFPANIILDEEAGRVLDEQSGISKSSIYDNSKGDTNGFHDSLGRDKLKKRTDIGGHNDSGGASRFFYQAKVGKRERNMGLEPVEVFSGRPRREDGSVIYKETHPEEWKEAIAKLPRKDKTALAGSEEKLQTQSTSVKNTHPTVKPVALMAYLVRLVTPPNGIVLDPFMGSGSTGIAARLEGFRFCGMEMDEDYFKIAESRIENFESYREFIKK